MSRESRLEVIFCDLCIRHRTSTIRSLLNQVFDSHSVSLPINLLPVLEPSSSPELLPVIAQARRNIIVTEKVIISGDTQNSPVYMYNLEKPDAKPVSAKVTFLQNRFIKQFGLDVFWAAARDRAGFRRNRSKLGDGKGGGCAETKNDKGIERLRSG